MNQNMREIAKRNADGGGFFFSKGAMSFFDSRIEDVGPFRFNDAEDTVMFVTSERFSDETDRAYTVRVASLHGATATNAYPVETALEFMAFGSIFEALDFIAGVMDDTLSVGIDCALWENM